MTPSCSLELRDEVIMRHFGLPADMMETPRAEFAVAGFHSKCHIRNPKRDCGKTATGQIALLDSLRWKWVPSNCRLHEGGREVWARVGKARRIIMMGDSVQEDMFNALQCLLPVSVSSGMGGTQLMFIREDHLGFGREGLFGNVTDDVLRIGTLMRGKLKFQKKATGPGGWPSNSSSVLIINAGAHWHWPMHKARAKFRAFARALRLVWEGYVVFRTTVMGHPCCHRFHGPVVSSSSINASWYNWRSFDAINRVAVEAFADWPEDKFRVLDVTSAFEHRADGHPGGHDCLHYCVASSAGVWWNRMLQHVLLETVM